MKSHLGILNQHAGKWVQSMHISSSEKLFTHLCSFIGFVYEEVCSTPLIGNLRKVKFFSRRRDCIELGSESLTQARIIAAGGREKSGECSGLSRALAAGILSTRTREAEERCRGRELRAGLPSSPPPPANPAISSSKKDSAWLSENNITDNFQHLELNKHPRWLLGIFEAKPSSVQYRYNLLRLGRCFLFGAHKKRLI